MKKKKVLILLSLVFFSIQPNERKTISIVIPLKKSKSHRFIIPVLAASELTVALYTLIPILLASLGNIHFCLPAAPEIILENDNNILHLK